MLLTVARQFVIHTQFPIILRYEAKPFPIEENNIYKERRRKYKKTIKN